MKNLSITQLIMAFSTLIISMLLVYGLVANIKVNNIGHHIEQIEKQYIPITKVITTATEHQLMQEIQYERVFASSLQLDNEVSASKHLKESKKAFFTLSEKIEEELSISHQLISIALSKLENSSNWDGLETIGNKIKELRRLRVNWNDHVSEVFTLFGEKDFKLATKKSDLVHKEGEVIEHLITNVLAEIEELTEVAVHQLKVEEEELLSISIIMLIFFIIIIIATVKYIVNTLNKDFKELKEKIKSIANGDVSSEVYSKLEIEFGIDKMKKGLHDIILEVDLSASEMLSASKQLATISGEVSENINEQAEQIELVATAVTEMEATSEDVASHTKETQNATNNVTDKASESKESTLKSMGSISLLTESLEESSKNIQELEAHSANISTVLDVIKSIAEQTNLLALNAAIEAARAGEQGRGFAVVADEVRNLAQRTQTSTIEIEGMISTFTQGTYDAVSSMKQCSSHGEASHQIAMDSTKIVEEIQSAMEDVNGMSEQIAIAAQEQSSTSQELSKNTNRIYELTSNNVEATERVLVTSEGLAKTSLSLKNKINHFKL